MKLQNVLEDFRNYLLLNFTSISSVLSDELLEDWLQSNWEIIVEARLQSSKIVKGGIDIYGEGADCNGNSSRVFLPESLPTSAIHIAPDYILDLFGTLVDGYFIQAPPFDYVKGLNPKSGDLILPIQEVKFSIGKTYDELAK